MRSVRRNIKKSSKHSAFKPAFTVIELIVVVVIIAILAGIIIVSYSSWRQSTTVAQLKSDLGNAASAMENYRTFNNGYPTDVTTLTTIAPSSGVTLAGGSSDGGLTYCVSAVNSQFPTMPYHIDSNTGGTGAVSGVCVLSQRTLATSAGSGGNVSAGGAFPLGSVQTITATPNTNFAFSSWTGDTGCSGAASHTITMDANKNCNASFVATAYILSLSAGSGGSVNSGGTYSPGSTQTITATPNQYYSFTNWAGNASDCYTPNTASHTVTMNADKTCTASFTPTAISAPAAPTVSVAPGSTTTYSWGAASCGGNTARYQYDYTTTPANYDSGWVPTAALSVGFTTTTPGQTYKVAVQAQCYNGVTSSDWSTPINSGSYSPFECTGCTVSYNGSYTLYSFYGNGTFITHVSGNISWLVVAGGGGGGYASAYVGGGGGGGGFLTGTSSLGISSFPVVVGGGGNTDVCEGTNGGNSSFNGTVATGGGGAGGGDEGCGGIVGRNGGSGGAGYYGGNGSGIGGQGNKAGTSYKSGSGQGGGGGAGSVGGNAGNYIGGSGGSGAQSSITGTSHYYSAGGGGDTLGHANQGSGGNGYGYYGSGGSFNTGGMGGVVIIRYPQ